MPPPYVLAAALASAFASGAENPVSVKIQFNRDVRPILSDLCFKCHGFDGKAREAGRRLDTRDGALEDQDGIKAIVPGKLAESEVHHRIHSTDSDEAMPPAKSGKKLSERQKAIIDQWIEQGAPYERHWAFEPVTKPEMKAVPRVHSAELRNPIDAFVLARLAQEGLQPTPEAERYTLCRRLYLDLVGLPPTPDEADDFIHSTLTNPHSAIENLVDRLMSSPHYGERWARRWLDLARYADTNGYEKDRSRSIWPWRDWVINALNADMPFDQFTIEQLAGDMLPNATPEQRIATGFHRNTMLNEEGGIDPLEFRFHAMTDRVATTGTTWLGLTVGCAQCHSHKYDPIQHREYYQVMAFLDNADEPDLDLPGAGFAAQRRDHEEKIARLIAKLPDKWPADGSDREAKFTAWLAREQARTVAWLPLRPAEAKSNMPLLTVQPDGSVLASGDITKTDTYALRFVNVPASITALRLEALPDERLPQHGPGMAYYEGPKGDFFMVDFKLSADGVAVKFGKASESYAKNAMGGSPATAALAIDDDLQTGWSTSGREGEAHEAVFQLLEPLPTANELVLVMIFGRHYAASLGRFRISVTTDRRGAEARDVAHDVATWVSLPDSDLTGAQRERLRTEFLLSSPELTAARSEIDNLRKSAPKPPTTLVMCERPLENPRPTFLRHRGEYLQPAERVEPGVFSFLPPLRRSDTPGADQKNPTTGVSLPPPSQPNRPALSRWPVSPE
ncbi:MAG: DUF1549 domain-containing protein, partial [Verrucomicrobiales bacterium]